MVHKCEWSERMGKQQDVQRKPDWLKIKLNTNESYNGLKGLMRERNHIRFVKKRVVLIYMNAGEKEELQRL